MPVSENVPFAWGGPDRWHRNHRPCIPTVRTRAGKVLVYDTGGLGMAGGVTRWDQGPHTAAAWGREWVDVLAVGDVVRATRDRCDTADSSRRTNWGPVVTVWCRAPALRAEAGRRAARNRDTDNSARQTEDPTVRTAPSRVDKDSAIHRRAGSDVPTLPRCGNGRDCRRPGSNCVYADNRCAGNLRVRMCTPGRSACTGTPAHPSAGHGCSRTEQ
jgi:hypothetical protein